MCMCVHEWNLEIGTWHLPVTSSTLILRQGLSLNPELADVADLVSHLAPKILFPLSQFYRQSTTPLGQHLHECYKSERWSSCMASTLPAKLSSQSYN